MIIRSIKDKLRIVIFGTNTKAGRRFDLILLWVILLSIIVVIIESVASIHSAYEKELMIVEWAFTIVFSIEYILRIWISNKPSKYIFSFMGVIDLLSILPTFLSLLFVGGQYFMVVRGLRLLRIFRILKMVNYLKEIRVLLNSLKNSLPKIGIFMLFILILVTILGSLMYVIEGNENGFKDIPNSIYWAIVTLATVGYGDITPITPLGKILASVIILIGYGIIAVPTGIITSEIIKEGRKDAEEHKDEVLVQPKCTSCGFLQVDMEAKFCSRCGEELV